MKPHLTDPAHPHSVRDQINGGVTQEARADLPTILLRIVDAYAGVMAPLAKQSIRDAAEALTASQAKCDQLEAVVRAILMEETVLVHDGYDDGPGGGNFVYVDAVRTDSDAFSLARAALQEQRP